MYRHTSVFANDDDIQNNEREKKYYNTTIFQGYFASILYKNDRTELVHSKYSSYKNEFVMKISNFSLPKSKIK